MRHNRLIRDYAAHNWGGTSVERNGAGITHAQ